MAQSQVLASLQSTSVWVPTVLPSPHCYNRGLSPEAAIDETVEGYDPTPDYMPIGEMF